MPIRAWVHERTYAIVTRVNMQVTEDQVKKLFASLDVNGDGKVIERWKVLESSLLQ